jgi:hypothetical protein
MANMVWRTKIEANSAELEAAAAARLLPGWLLAQRNESFGLPLFGGLFSSPVLEDDDEAAALEADGIYSTRVSP